MKHLLLTLCLLLPLSLWAQTNRSYDGSQNNQTNPNWGQAQEQLMYMLPMAYADSISDPAGVLRPNPRMVSNLVFDQTQSIPNALDISDFGWAFGQFMDHDLSFVLDDVTEPLNIPIPAFDPFFDPTGTGSQAIHMFRSLSDPTSGTSISNPRQHINDITGWIDASNVYGSDAARAMWLRTLQGGKLKTSTGNFLPYNTTTGEESDPVDPNAPFMLIEGMPRTKFFVAGDVRANEQPILASMHTLFVREHNRVADSLAALNPSWDDEALYQKSRKIVGGIFAAIAFEEWLPALGITLDPYTGYDANVDPRIMNVFSAAAFRLGHTLINGELQRIENDGTPSTFGNINLKDAFFNPEVIVDEGGIEPFFNGMVSQRQQNFDAKVISDLRNFLFGAPGAGGLDLVSINLNRGRERGLIDYNWIRQEVGLSKYTDFSQITSDANLANTLKGLYGSIENVDPWVGMLSEDHMPGTAVGITVFTILKMQFEHLRDGDRFYYENDVDLTAQEIATIKATRLSEVILRNTTITELTGDVFHVPNNTSITSNDLLPLHLNAYPNPLQSELNISLQASERETAQVMLADLQGRVILRDTWEITPGENRLKMPLNTDLAAGMYSLSVRTGSSMGVIKVVK